MPRAVSAPPGVPRPRARPALPGWVELLQFWFGDDPDDARVAENQRPLWFGQRPEHDRAIADRFAGLLGAGEAGRLDRWRAEPRSQLASVILFDQVSRVVGRGTHRAFQNDGRALALARAMLDTDAETGLRPIERVFLFLPLEHAEDLALQEENVARCSALATSVPAPWRDAFDPFVDYARRHEAVIRRFGRFPHRNAILGRHSTPEETAFLSAPDAGF